MTVMVDARLGQLKGMPVREDSWQLGLAAMPLRVEVENHRPFRPRVVLCRSAATGLLGSGDPLRPDNPLEPAALAAILSLAAMPGVRYRPSRLELKDAALAEALAPALEAAGIAWRVVQRLDLVDEVVADMARHLGSGGREERLYDGPGVDAPRLRGFAEAAAAFYRATLWNHLTDRDLVRVDSAVPDEGLRWLTVLGAGGREFGIGFYASKGDHRRLVTSESPLREVARIPRWFLTFDPAHNLPTGDAELWDTEQLPVAGETAYPLFARFIPDKPHGRAGTETFSFIEALLRALAETSEDDLDCGRWSKTVSASDGERTMELSIPALLEPSRKRGPGGGGRALPDRRIMERPLLDMQRLIASREFGSIEEVNAFLHSKCGRVPAHAPAGTPAERAHELFYEALEAEGRMRMKLAREALRIWPDCADALVLRAEAMPDLERRALFYREAMAAAERTLGPAPFANDIGHFWGVVETRPYMRARNGYAECLWDAGRCDEAFEHWKELLRLNPSDNQGMRFVVVPRLLEMGRDEDAAQVLGGFEDDVSALVAYARALVQFRGSGDGETSRRALATAVRANPHAVKYLMGSAELPADLPEHYTLGGEDEAAIATSELVGAWEGTPGAVEWLRDHRRRAKKEREKKRQRAAERKR